VIIDASAAVDALLGSTRCEGGLTQIERTAFLAAPQLLHVEVPSAIWRLTRSGLLDDAAAARSLHQFLRLRVDLVDHAALLPRAWSFRRANRISDCFYLAAATALGVPLLTTDDRLGRGHHGVPVVTVS
jgi:predicted nucleic acid-binding protein